MSRGTWGQANKLFHSSYGTLTLYGRPFQAASKQQNNTYIAAPQPRMNVSTRFRLIPVRSPLLGESHMLSFPPGTKMFQFPGCPLSILYIQMAVTGHYSRRVPPFGNLEIIACMQLPQAYRRLHVLHRHSAPRHPPDALYSLKNNTIKSPCSWMKSPNNINPFTTAVHTTHSAKQHQEIMQKLALPSVQKD